MKCELMTQVNDDIYYSSETVYMCLSMICDSNEPLVSFVFAHHHYLVGNVPATDLQAQILYPGCSVNWSELLSQSFMG